MEIQKYFKTHFVPREKPSTPHHLQQITPPHFLSWQSFKSELLMTATDETTFSRHPSSLFVTYHLLFLTQNGDKRFPQNVGTHTTGQHISEGNVLHLAVSFKCTN